MADKQREWEIIIHRAFGVLQSAERKPAQAQKFRRQAKQMIISGARKRYESEKDNQSPKP